jgi:hypothetical protein
MASREAARKPAAESGKDILGAALAAFSDLTPPSLPVKKIEQVTPENAAEVLDALSAYLDEAGEAVVAVMRLILHELRGKSFASLAETKEFASKFQRILDRVNQAVECPSCGELGKYEGVSHHTVATGMVRVKHPGRTTHAGTTVVTELPIKKQA